MYGVIIKRVGKIMKGECEICKKDIIEVNRKVVEGWSEENGTTQLPRAT